MQADLALLLVAVAWATGTVVLRRTLRAPVAARPSWTKPLHNRPAFVVPQSMPADGAAR